jgi:hypothetical protein
MPIDTPKPKRKRRRHGLCSVSHRTYRSWWAMTDRCTNPNHPAFDDYRGRGIVVCDRWLGLEGPINFLADMGERPLGTSLDRIDNNGNYEPGNCRWATRRQQNRNTRSNRRIEFRGESLLLCEWAERLGMKYVTVCARLRKGWPIEKVLTAPVRPWHHRGIACSA